MERNRENKMNAKMNDKKLNAIKTLLAIAAPVFFADCGQNPMGSADREIGVVNEDANGTVRSTIVLGKVGALSKSATIGLQKLILTAVSSATPADTVKDTAVVSGNAAVTVLRTLTLKPLRNWVINAKTVDGLDSVIHSGSTASFFVKPADTTAVSLNLASKFSMYQANFNGLPDSIAATGTGTGKDKLNLNRVVLKVDGIVKDDSVMASGFFAAGQNISVYFDYIDVGSHTVTLEAYGTLHTYTGILYTGTTSFNVGAGNDDTQAVTLNWAGPTTGNGKLTVILGKVGKVIVNGGLSGTVL
jgi:hypothetical protein